MKHLKHLLTAALTMLVALAVAVPAFAATAHSITVENTNDSISINGHTYSAYKLFDSTHQGTAYSYTMSTSNQFYSADLIAEQAPAEGSLPALLKQYFDFAAVPGDATKINVAPKDGFDARAFADAIQPFLADMSASATSPEAENEQAVITLPDDDAGQGYYIVTGDAVPTDPNSQETVVSAVILTNEDPAQTVKPKAGIPTLDKKVTGVTEDTAEDTAVVEGAVLDDNGQAAVAKVGSTVSYEIDSIVPDLTGYTTYTFKLSDTISAGLSYVKESFELKIGDNTVDIDPVFADGDKSFTLTIDYGTLKESATGAAITLTYDATVNSEALTYDYEKNTAKLEYSSNPYSSETNETPVKTTYILDINIDVLKVNNSQENLDGAEFKLYREVTTGEGDEAQTTKEFYRWADNKVTWVSEEDAEVFVTDTTGNLKQKVSGLDQGTYYLLETKAPTGYNLLIAPVAVNIVATEAADGGSVTYTAKFDDADASVTNATVDLTTAQQDGTKQPVATGTIVNHTGTELPSTGGIGTTIFYVVGGAMVITAAVLLITKRRMSKLDK